MGVGSSKSVERSSIWIAALGAAVAFALAMLNPLARLFPEKQMFSFFETLVQYITFSTTFYFIFWIFLRNRMQYRKLSRKKLPKTSQMFREAAFSTASQVIFITVDVWIAFLVPQSVANSYTEIAAHGWIYYAFILVLVFVLHDAYFYWAHRAMHHPWLYRRVHWVHHESTDPTPYTAFHFHPIEALLEGGASAALLAIFCFLPWHTSIPIAWGYGQLALNVIGHLGYEVYPSWWNRVPGLRLKTTSMHHYLHHQLVGGNYGLYFRWWDKLCGTEFPDYERRYNRLFENAAAARIVDENPVSR
jgi:Delta7-sterol 5-desaturase